MHHAIVHPPGEAAPCAQGRLRRPRSVAHLPPGYALESAAWALPAVASEIGRLDALGASPADIARAVGRGYLTVRCQLGVWRGTGLLAWEGLPEPGRRARRLLALLQDGMLLAESAAALRMSRSQMVMAMNDLRASGLMGYSENDTSRAKHDGKPCSGCGKPIARRAGSIWCARCRERAKGA